MRFLPSRADFALDAAAPLRVAPPAPPPATLPTVFAIGRKVWSAPPNAVIVMHADDVRGAMFAQAV